MKKVFIILMMALMSLGAFAQTSGYQGEIDEMDLAGYWNVESIEGNIYGEHSFLGFNLNSYGYGKVDTGGEGDALIAGYFISNTNKLHLEMKDAPSWSFLILEYINSTPSYLKIQTYDGKCTMLWRKSTYSSVRSLRADGRNNDAMYTIQGIKTDTPDGIYIQNGKKIIVK